MTTTAAPVLSLSTTVPDFAAQLQQRLHWSAAQDSAIEDRVAAILADVQARGDAAVLDYSARFDGLQAASVADLELTAEELEIKQQVEERLARGSLRLNVFADELGKPKDEVSALLSKVGYEVQKPSGWVKKKVAA